MDETRYSRRPGVKRHAVVIDRDCCLGVISFENRVWTEHSVKIVDLSVTGMGIETERQIEPGFVWFKEHVSGQRGGFLVWSRKFGDRYRGGIQFVSLTRAEEVYLRRQVSLIQPRDSFEDPDRILADMINDFHKDRGRPLNSPA